MNEIQLIQSHLALQRVHAVQIAGECAGGSENPQPPSDLRQAGAEYLEHVLGWFAARDQRLAALVQSLPAGRTGPDLGPAADSREALELLGAARSRGEWAPLARFLSGRWSRRREALEQWLTACGRTAEWRAVSALTADMILQERELYARTRAPRASGGVGTAHSPDVRRGQG